MTEVTTHDSVKIIISKDSNNGTHWTVIKAVDSDDECIVEFTLFGKQEILLSGGDMGFSIVSDYED